MKDVQVKEEWHMEQRIIVGIIITVLGNMGISIWNTSFLLRTLDTNPPIVQRIMKLEYHMSEHGQVNQKILDVLGDLRKDSRKFREEQSRRTPMINYIERKMGSK